MIEKEILVESIRTPRTREVGDIAALAKSIANEGLLHPIAIDSRCNLLLGSRRLAAVKLLDWPTVPVVECSTIDDVLKRISIDQDTDDDASRPMTVREGAELGLYLDQFWEPELRERKRQTASYAGQIRRRGDQPKRPRSKRDGTFVSQQIPRLLGFRQTTFGSMKHMVRAMRFHTNAEVRRVAAEQLALYERGEKTLNAAYRVVRQLTREATDFSKPPSTGPLVEGLAAQRRAFNSLNVQLRGITTGLVRIEHIDPGLTVDEVAETLETLVDMRRGMERIINKMRRHLTERNSTP